MALAIPAFKDFPGGSVHRRNIDISECTLCRSMPSIWQSTQGGTLLPDWVTPTMTRSQRILYAGDRQCPTYRRSLNILGRRSPTFTRRAEDISIEYNALYIGTAPRDIHIRALHGVTIGFWELNNWGEADNANATLWLDHSISTWKPTATQWHMNTYSVITMLN
eukprot:4577221-Amphidinium_carterae.3